MEKRNAGLEHCHGQASTSSLISRRTSSAAGHRQHPSPSRKDPNNNHNTVIVGTTNQENNSIPSRHTFPSRIGGAPPLARSSPVSSPSSRPPPSSRTPHRGTTTETGLRTTQASSRISSCFEEPPECHNTGRLGGIGSAAGPTGGPSRVTSAHNDGAPLTAVRRHAQSPTGPIIYPVASMVVSSPAESSPQSFIGARAEQGSARCTGVGSARQPSSAVPQLKLRGINDPPALLAAHDLRSGAAGYPTLDSVAANKTYIRQVNAAPRRDTSPPRSSPPRHQTGARIASLSPRSSATPSGQARVLARSCGGDRFIAPVNSFFLMPPNDMGLIGRPFSAHERGRSGQIPSHMPLTSYLERCERDERTSAPHS